MILWQLFKLMGSEWTPTLGREPPSQTNSTARSADWSERNGRQDIQEVNEGRREGRVKGDAAKPFLLSGGNPQIAKADGDAPVQAYIAAMPGWKSDVGRRLDDLIVRRAVRWNSPWHGIEGEGWFVSCHVFTHYVKVTFINGASLRPVPHGSGKDPDSRWIDIYEDDLDETQMATWVRQAAALPGWDLT